MSEHQLDSAAGLTLEITLRTRDRCAVGIHGMHGVPVAAVDQAIAWMERMCKG